jgi:MoaA/NifB/PqqE/SkfB family radical SAM enzyme
VAVSRYDDKNVCYDAVKRLTDAGLTQVNIHQLVAVETLPNIMETIQDIKQDARLEKLNAIVFLTLKPKGKRNNLTMVNDGHYKELVEMCLKEKINFGFDSCSANRFLRVVKGHQDYDKFAQVSEPCESSLFSAYIDVRGTFFPCSFSSGEGRWTEGVDVVNCSDFIEDVWNHPKTLRFRSDLLMRCRDCPLFDI